MAIVTDSAVLAVLNEWAIANNYQAPLYDSSINTVRIAGVEDASIKAVLDAATASDILDAQTRTTIRQVQLLNPKPKNATVAQSKKWALLIASKVIQLLRAKATTQADAVTLSGWVDKLAIAEKINANTASSDETAIIQAEADMRDLNETATQLAVKIIAKGMALRTVRSKIDGFDDKIKRQLNAVTDRPSYDAIVATLVTDGSAIINQLGA